MPSLEEIREERIKKFEELLEKGVNPYRTSFKPTKTIKEVRDAFTEGEKVSLAGRLMSIRLHGKSIFCDLRDTTSKIQIYIKKDIVGEEKFNIFNLIDIGDIIGINGELFKTHTNEFTVKVDEFFLLSKAIRPLPEKWHGLKDIEIRYRQRYLDLVSNEEVKDVFLSRIKIVKAIREFLHKREFVEVETPMMQSIPGGAAARPFTTHHNALGIDLYMRIAPELYLKRLLVGGFDRVYELNRNFRNEGISTRHNPEFTMLEVYQAYADYTDMMKLVEDMFKEIAMAIFGKLEIPFKDGSINLSKEWPRVSMFDALEKETGIDFKAEKDIKAVAKKLSVEFEKDFNDMQVMNKIFEKLVEPKLISPTFIIDFPTKLCPLAKTKADNPELTERFELFIGAQEVANAYSELNDPMEQDRRFKEQSKSDEEGFRRDDDFVIALEHGMPPAGGLGVGIDRLVMVFTNQPSIRDVILFPQLKPEAYQQDQV